MKRLSIAIFITLASTLGPLVFALDTAESTGAITNVHVNPDNFVFFVNTVPSNGDCRDGQTSNSGYHMNSSQSNYREALSVVLTAYLMEKTIGFKYFEDPTVTDASPCNIDRVSF